MQYSFTFQMLGTVLGSMIRPDIRDKQTRRNISREYRAVVLRAGDIGSHNRLLTSYGLTAYFIAMNRFTGLTPEQNRDILETRMRQSKMLKMFMGSSKGYFSEKNMESRRQWSRETYRRKYKNDWVVDVLEKTDDYEFGFDYRECGDCKLCRDEGCPELTKYMCSLDFMLVEIIGIHLDRTMTLAEGCEKCDFRFRK